ncbi:hypothetical protein P9D51_24075 [Bacillus sonorensis]|uniref:hypothetical protein n=1 Tax=Bacillus sonorensis TaxID=119858 RepID=UPI00227DF6F3|nr:hypothetical protein [Bacillus sonorensis]MCY7858678.1 hypothetical protein [Bacillus sonorensis]MCY8562183.1 hypothetical protein [Bacillus sonorensis]MEC1428923.1 hypothetical protein [Bacillus sonorensis]MEC1429123.1 hypothetical protein [Bacillus sonorensis]
MKYIKSITVNSDTYIVGQTYKPPGFTDGATIKNIVDNRRAFSFGEGGFEIRFDTGELLRIHSNNVIVHWVPAGGKAE